MTDDKVVALMRQLGIELDLSHGDPTFYMGLGEVQAFAQLVRNEALEECANVCDEMHEHYTGLKDTALLNRDVDLSNAMSGEPRACEFIAQQIRSMK